jgi:hypothetical protein
MASSLPGAVAATADATAEALRVAALLDGLRVPVLLGATLTAVALAAVVRHLEHIAA